MSFKCYHCEREFEDDPYVTVDDDLKKGLCQECYTAHTTLGHETPYAYVECHCCGDVFTNDGTNGEFVHHNNDTEYFVCSHCLNMSDDYYQCAECGEYWHKDYTNHTEQGYVCDECLDSCNYCVCEDCGDYVDEAHQVVISTASGSDYVICTNCYESGDYGTCDDCGRTFHYEDLTWIDEDCEERYCPDCVNRHQLINDRVLEYSEEHHVRLEPLCTSEDYKRCAADFVGFELEYIDTGIFGEDPSSSNAPRHIFRKLEENDLLDMAKSTLDSTVSGEVVTAPMTMDYLYSTKGFERLTKVCNIIKDANCVAWDSKFETDNDGKHYSCGGHIHVSHEFAVNLHPGIGFYTVGLGIAYLLTYTNRFWHRLSGRREVSNWAKFDTDMRHYSALNNTDDTYEFRFWQGTLNPETLRVRATLCAAVVSYISDIPEPVEWAKGNCEDPTDARWWEALQTFFEQFAGYAPLETRSVERMKPVFKFVYDRLKSTDGKFSEIAAETKFKEWFYKFYEEKYKENNQ